jgi:DNA-binding transcriptional MerR regulator
MIFTTEIAAEILGLEPWRVTKFVQSKEYGIKPSLAQAKGSGSRRLYSAEDICQIGLALRLLETALRSKAIGKVIRQAQAKGKLSRRFLEAKTEGDVYLAIYRKPQMGRPLDESRSQSVDFVSKPDEVLRNLTQHAEEDVIFVPLASLISKLRKGLAQAGGE